MPARIRIPSYAVWESAVFVLNVLAFVFIGLQIRPILDSLEPDVRTRYLWVAGAVVLTVIVGRIVWVMLHNGIARWRIRQVGFHPPRPTSPPTVGSGLVISWSGMRGIVSLAAALALPEDFPYRGLIVLTSFAVVLGTLVVQGLTLRPLMRVLHLPEDDPVTREVETARERALEAAYAALGGQSSPAAHAVRHLFEARLSRPQGRPPGDDEMFADQVEMHLRALNAARSVTFSMRAEDDIGDDAFHRLEEEFDWIEMSIGRRGEPNPG
jgi:CPA1 family monovalent cation:H+ antiporter